MRKSKKVIYIMIPVDEAQDLTQGIADTLCWLRGWRANATPEQMENCPLGIEDVRKINAILKTAIETAGEI